MKYVYIIRTGSDLFPARGSIEAALQMTMERAQIFDLQLQSIAFDPFETEIVFYDPAHYEFVSYFIDRVPYSEH